MVELDENTYAIKEMIGHPSDWRAANSRGFTIYDSSSDTFVFSPPTRGGFQWRDDLISLVWKSEDEMDNGIKRIVSYHDTQRKQHRLNDHDIFDGYHYVVPVLQHRRKKYHPDKGKIDLFYFESFFVDAIPLNVWVFE